MNPLSVISKKDVNVNIEIKNFGQDNTMPASVVGNNNNYNIYINQNVLDMFPKYKETLKNGLILHEAAHIEYDSLKFRYLDNKFRNIWFYVDNILEDSRIEYNLSLDYPMVAQYFDITLQLMKGIIHIDKNIKEMTDEEIEFNELIQQIYSFVRYNEIPKNKELYNFILPIVLSSKRGNRKNSTLCVNALFRYLIYNLPEIKDEDLKNNSNMDLNSDSNNTDSKQTKDNKSNNDNKQNVIKMLSDLQKTIDKNKQVKVGIGIKSGSSGNDDNVLQASIKNKDFYYKTMKNNLILIHEIEKVFRKHLNKNITIFSKDGDISVNPIKQMNAYIDSFTYNEGYNYLKTKQIETQFDCIIFRDISWSTEAFKETYAEITVCFIESLSRFKYVNIASIDFGSQSKITKNFKQTIPGIIPYSYGTTNLAEALSLAQKEIKWTNNKRYVIILTDGYPDNINEVFKELNKNYYKNTILIPIIINLCNVDLFKNQIYVTNVKEIPKKLMEVLI